MKRIALLTCCAAALAGLSLASARTERSADALVYDAMAAPATVSYTGVVETVRVGDRGSEVSIYRIEHRAPNETLRKYTSPSALSGDSVITRGVQSFSVDAGHRRVVAGKNDAVNDQIAVDNNYLLLRQNYRAIARNAESFDGRDVVVVTLINNYTHKTTLLVRIDKQSKLVLDKQQFSADGSLVSETRFEEVRYDVTIPAADFAVPKEYAAVTGASFSMPSDDPHGVAANAGFGAREPKFLPEGFSPVEGSVDVLHGVRTLHVLYSDGIRTVSLFENGASAAVDMTGLRPQTLTIEGRDAQFAQSGPTAMLAWRDGSLYCELVGELRLDELKRIAGSI